MTTEQVEQSGTLAAIVNENARALMARRRISNVTLADRLGFSTQALWRRQSGVVAWNTDELEALAAVLDVDVTELLAPAAS